MLISKRNKFIKTVTPRHGRRGQHILKKWPLLFLWTLAACISVGPDYERVLTQADQSGGFVNAYYEDTQNIQQPMTLWWTRINDPLLDRYIEQLLTDNLALEEAAARIAQAHERVNIEQGGFFPAIGADGSAGRSFSAPSGTRTYTTAYDAGLNASWTLDLFGQIRRSVESEQALFDASIYDREALVHTLIADVLNRRVAIAVNQRLLDLARKNASNRETFYDLTKKRYALGAQGTAARDVYLAEESYSSINADILQFERLLAAESYRLDVLLGQRPGTTDSTQASFPALPPPRDVALCIPADLLDRRPDLKASELRLQAATADIGIAVADLYPGLNLAGGIGFSGSSLSNIISTDQLAGSILGSITTRLFEGGRLRANIRLQEERARELTAAYAGDVLEAMREVETALKNEQTIAAELTELENSAAALRQAERNTYNRYTRGINTLQDFLDIQQRRYIAEQTVLRAQQDKWTARINLYLALGGDWHGQNAVYSECAQFSMHDQTSKDQQS